MGILQAKILQWVAMPSSRGSSPPRDGTQVSHIVGRLFTMWATREAQLLRRGLCDWGWVNLDLGFPGDSDGKESACNMKDTGLIPGLRRTHGEGNGNPLQYSSLEKSMDREAWQATVYGVTKSWTQLSD